MAGRDECRALAEMWRGSSASLGLIVPSAVIPEAYDLGDVNVVLDPLHRAFSAIPFGAPIELEIDQRLRGLVAPAQPSSVPGRRRPRR